ncbi:hypothetical protein AB0H43_03010 [Hamadaea sp. NPDC050747]|uniref:hypothetical protein n=1 Tax=Hamadaea sp. NPDC050747 TaxID=3155789 RepID=UPI0033D9CBB0
MTTFPDARLAALTVLRDLAPTEATYGTKDYDDIPEAERPELPYVAVRVDLTTVRYPITAQAALRILVWDVSEYAAEQRAWRLHAVLLDYRGGPDMGKPSPELGPQADTDDETGRPFAVFTVSARLRPQST